MIIHKKVYNLTKHSEVEFMYFCARDVEYLAPIAKKYNDVVEEWLLGNDICNDEIVNELYDLSQDNQILENFVAYYVLHTSLEAISSLLTWDIIEIDEIIVNASCAITHHQNGDKYLNEKIVKEYNQIVKNWLSVWTIPNLPQDDDFPIFDYLQDHNLIQHLLPKRRKNYYLNLIGFDIKHKDQNELLKLVNTDLVKTILRRIINNGRRRYF